MNYKLAYISNTIKILVFNWAFFKINTFYEEDDGLLLEAEVFQYASKKK